MAATLARRPAGPPGRIAKFANDAMRYGRRGSLLLATRDAGYREVVSIGDQLVIWKVGVFAAGRRWSGEIARRRNCAAGADRKIAVDHRHQPAAAAESSPRGAFDRRRPIGDIKLTCGRRTWTTRRFPSHARLWDAGIPPPPHRGGWAKLVWIRRAEALA